jgi:hypothetical protein
MPVSEGAVSRADEEIDDSENVKKQNVTSYSRATAYTESVTEWSVGDKEGRSSCRT